MKRAAIVAVLLSSAASEVRADPNFFELSPGPLTEAHAEWDDETDNCTKCHELGKGVSDLKCLDCHQHNPLRDAIKAGKGLHASFQLACRKCHTEHKGRDAFIIDWDQVGGRAKFDHKRTGFPLTGQHEEVTCTACHKRQLRSGRTSFIALDESCDSCHKNPHKFASQDLRDACKVCHVPGVKKKISSRDLFFDHGERTGFALTGAHGKADCRQCHAGAIMNKPAKPRGCFSCHKKDSPHGKSFERSRCEQCHASGETWKKSSFDHADTGFPLRGEHDTKRCGKCHKIAEKAPSRECSSCHKDPHKTRFAQLSCESCHGEGGKKKPRFDHQKTEFVLTGKHASLDCRSCHRGKGPRAFERFETADCRGCHAHKNAHDGQFGDKSCLDCHAEGGSTKLAFDHDKDTRFALNGFHDPLDCSKCHSKGNFRTGKMDCADCHKDSHRGELGAKCDRCHQSDVHFAEIKFDHNKLAKFPLKKKHQELKCEQCHPDRRYRIAKGACVDCHAEDDPHRTKLGNSCEKCHEPTPGAPKFAHESMTSFARTGKHLETKCDKCHLDKTFPVKGEKCADCHTDVHKGSHGTACESCHNTTDFRAVERAVHDTGAFRLDGTHDLLACARCHEPGRQLAGLGAMCGECHRSDDAHNNALGPMCGKCHKQIEWFPARFNHATVGFILRGAHATARCADCHTIGRYLGTPRECGACHSTTAAKVVEPVHNEALNDCARCHREIAFSPARRDHPRFPLSGAHAVATCSSCHPAGRYFGTPGDCASCHREDAVAAKSPNHTAANFVDRCESCHVAATWSGARYQHRTFALRGLHRTLSCDRCHTAERYDSAFAGTVSGYACESCHASGGPVNKRPADHDARGYPNDCNLCHSELAWTPAKKPR